MAAATCAEIAAANVISANSEYDVGINGIAWRQAASAANESEKRQRNIKIKISVHESVIWPAAARAAAKA